MTKYIFIGLGLGLAGFLVILLAVAVVKPKTDLTQSPVQTNPAVLGTEQKNIPTPTQFIYNSPTPILEKVYKYGEKVTLKDGRYITVFTPIDDYKPEQSYMAAPEGKKYVLVEVEYGNAGSKKTACSVTLRLGDDKDVFYDNSMGVKLPAPYCNDHEDQTYLQPGKTTRGFVTFQVNTDTVIKKIIYHNYEHQEKIVFASN